MQGEFAAREDAARELEVVTDRLQGSGNLQEDERAMLLRKQDQLTHTLEQHSTQVTSPSLHGAPTVCIWSRRAGIHTLSNHTSCQLD